MRTHGAFCDLTHRRHTEHWLGACLEVVTLGDVSAPYRDCLRPLCPVLAVEL